MDNDKITLSRRTEIDAAIKKLARYYPRLRWGNGPNRSAIVIEALRADLAARQTAGERELQRERAEEQEK